ncbi:MAG: helix-turn-helix transcriptional regulator [Chitinophagales bacterium]|nr:helix-turn-helix transcriptional regulator [Chitinophagales bacterium]
MKLIVDFILIAGLLLNLIVLAGLFRLKYKQLPQRILIVFWCFILIIILHFYAALHGLRTFNRITFLFEDGARFFLPPLVFLYIKSIFFNTEQFLKKNIKHFIPVVGYFIGYTFPRFINLWTDPDMFNHINIIHRYINITIIKDAFAISYFLMALLMLIRVRKSMKHHYSYMKEKDFSWLSKFLICFLAVVGLDFILTIIEITAGYNVEWDGYITMTLLIFSMGYLGFNGLSQSTIFLPDFLINKNLSQERTGIAVSDNMEQVKQELEKTMKLEKPYLDSKLTLRSLAEKINISERKLSTLLNEVMQISFYDYVNMYRVQEVTELLSQEEYSKYSVEGIGKMCGFNSKSTFFRVFKKVTGFSPAAYVANLKD